ncbi:cobyrinic acid a,c-diamide synthase [Pandoraea faecigallinarum]|uniref:Cobyrinate a,c-diamide synthase n=1 Tax=Pandoraea faecigallinarum TaxID=656179 RepID=A0A0H3WPE5_9BURK|nr:cobyrinate a,c-diamide synthase [Pandoraea faecigallinarum]AKM29707.1 cobyrinic acid a,c-diamide synthase [Pandoraea faecigallinarum]
MASCPALFIGAPASGQGKTTVTAGLARLHRDQGRKVRVFKTGPDFLDPKILERASGAPVQTLDLWMVGEAQCRQLLAEAAQTADLILIEGVMGLFDGTPSSADLATTFGIPVVTVISAKSMAQTFGAIASGLAHYRPGLPTYGVLANHVGSPRHAQLLREGMPADIAWLGHLGTSDRMTLPARHLGLHQAHEIDRLDERIAATARALAETALAALPPAIAFEAPPSPALAQDRETLKGMQIAVARDAAFSFVYPENIRLLTSLGANVTYFSPLANDALPAAADALFLPGGYPELHAATLAANTRSASSIRAHAAAGKPVVAECGGMLYLLERLTDASGISTPMLGVLPGHATLQTRLAGLGMQEVATPRGTLRGHTFHYTSMATPMTPVCHARRAGSDTPGEPVFRVGATVATYLHGYWPSNPALTAALFHGTAF